MAKTVYRAKQGIALSVEGRRYHFSTGELILEDHPVKPKDHSDFEEISEYVERTSQPRRRGVLVEQATAEPGEKRSIGRPRGAKKAAAKKAEPSVEKPQADSDEG